MALDDTHPDVRKAQLARLSQMTATERFQMAAELSAATVRWSRDAIRATMPGAPESQVILRWIEMVYGKNLAAGVAPFADRLGKQPNGA